MSCFSKEDIAEIGHLTITKKGQKTMSKERLVELLNKFKYDCLLSCKDGFITVKKDCDTCVVEQLADYLLANGVIVPPVKVGDRVYMVIHDKRTKKPLECNVIGFWYTNHEDCCTIHLSRYVDGKFDSTFSVRYTDVGKTVFLTREEAEKELEKRDV